MNPPGLFRFSLPALASAFLLLFAQPPFGFILFAFMALVPLVVALGALPEGPAGAWRASLLGAVFGITFWFFSLLWVPLVVGGSFSWAFPGYGLLLILLGGLSALFGWTVHRLHRAGRVPLALAVPLAWVGVEWLRAHFPMGLAFPWLGLGVTLTGWPELLGLAEWTGERGVAFWLAGVNGLVSSRLMAWTVWGETGDGGTGEFAETRSVGAAGAQGAGLRLVPWFLLGGVVILPAGLGIARANSLPLSPGPRIGVVGTALGVELRSDPVASSRTAVREVLRTLSTTMPGSVDLVVLPEATLLLPLADDRAQPFLDALSLEADRLGVPLVFGGLGGAAGSDRSRDDSLTNSAYLMPPGGGPIQRYDKVRLVPGMEWGRYEKGIPGRVLTAGDWVLAPLLCYESLFGDLARDQRLEGGQILLNLTSDIWFGGAEDLLGSAFLRQHPAHLVVRVVENRMPAARAANGGYSALLGPSGRPVSQPVPPGGGLAVARVPLMDGPTFFTRTGDLVGPLTILISLILGGLAPGRRRTLGSSPSA